MAFLTPPTGLEGEHRPLSPSPGPAGQASRVSHSPLGASRPGGQLVLSSAPQPPLLFPPRACAPIPIKPPQTGLQHAFLLRACPRPAPCSNLKMRRGEENSCPLKGSRETKAQLHWKQPLLGLLPIPVIRYGRALCGGHRLAVGTVMSPTIKLC